VIVCAGTIASPQLLLLSGIGDGATLARLGVAVVADRVEVGRNLQEHVRTPLAYRTRVASYNRRARGWRLGRELLRYGFMKRGVLTTTASEVNGFVRTTQDTDRPDLQLVFRPSSGDYKDGRYIVHAHEGVMAMAGLLHPRSRGHVALKSTDPHAPPAIVAAHLADDADVAPLLAGVHLLRRIFATRPLADFVAEEIRPGPQVRDDAALREYVYATADSLYHAVGTCAMGTDARAVTTPALRVRGVAALRVVDASVMPSLPSGNTTAAVLMIAERAADFILAA
jgi:choline dehydrogenase